MEHLAQRTMGLLGDLPPSLEGQPTGCPHTLLVQGAVPQARGELVTAWAVRTAPVNWVRYTEPLKHKALVALS